MSCLMSYLISYLPNILPHILPHVLSKDWWTRPKETLLVWVGQTAVAVEHVILLMLTHSHTKLPTVYCTGFVFPAFAFASLSLPFVPLTLSPGSPSTFADPMATVLCLGNGIVITSTSTEPVLPNHQRTIHEVW